MSESMTEATEAALKALTGALGRSDPDMTTAAARALDALSTKAATDNNLK